MPYKMHQQEEKKENKTLLIKPRYTIDHKILSDFKKLKCERKKKKTGPILESKKYRSGNCRV